MKMLISAALAGGAAVALAGTALAASSSRHAMDVALPGGGVAHIEYQGEVAPKVTIAPAARAQLPNGWQSGWTGFPGIDRMIEQMNRQMFEIQRRARQPSGAPGMNVAGFGDLPAGADSVSVVSVSNGGRTCTRTAEVTSAGAGKPPRVTTKVSGDCAEGSAAPAAPQPSAAPINRT